MCIAEHFGGKSNQKGLNTESSCKMMGDGINNPK